MSTAVSIQYSSREADALLRSLLSKIERPRTLILGVGNALKERFKAHFSALNASRNSSGRNFYAQFGRSSNLQVKANEKEGTLFIGDERGMLRHKITGGRVLPSKRYLAIPLTSEAKLAGTPGAKTIPDTFVRTVGTRKFISRKTGVGRVENLWVLLRSVTHKPHPEAMPSQKDYARTVQEACEEFAADLEG